MHRKEGFMTKSAGIHHITGIAGSPRRHVEFYTRVLGLELAGSRAVAAQPGWAGEVPAEHAIRGFFGVTLWLENPAATAKVLTEVLGFVAKASEESRQRFAAEGPLGAIVDLRNVPAAFAGSLGPGTLHHVAVRAAGDAHQATMAGAGRPLRL